MHPYQRPKIILYGVYTLFLLSLYPLTDLQMGTMKKICSMQLLAAAL